MPKIVKPLTAKEVSSAITLATKQGKEKWLSDGGGLALKIGASGSAKFWFRYRHPVTKTQQYKELGEHSSLFGLSEARKLAAQEREILRNGKDPNEVAAELQRMEQAAKEAEAAEKARLAAQITVNALFERWAATDLVRRKDGGKEIRRMFQKDVLPLLGSYHAKDITKGHITAVTDKLLARGVTRMGKQIFSLMRQMFRFAESRDIVELDPTAKIRKIDIGGKDTERDRVLSELEIGELLTLLPVAKLVLSTEIAIWLCLSTCCRIGELLKAEWAHIDLERRAWRIPAENSKNGKAHTVYLSEFSIKQFKALLVNQLSTIDEGTKVRWCFPNRDNTDHVCGKTVSKQIGDRQRAGKPILGGRCQNKNALVLPGGTWTPHDLRRTGATMMVSLGVIPEVAERCLNHLEQNKVKRIYQRHNYEREMRDAWERLGERLEMLTSSNRNNLLFLKKTA